MMTNRDRVFEALHATDGATTEDIVALSGVHPEVVGAILCSMQLGGEARWTGLRWELY